MIRGGYQVKANQVKSMHDTNSNIQTTKRRDHTPITGKKIKTQSQNSRLPTKRQGQKVERISLIQKKDHHQSQSQNIRQSGQNQRTAIYQFNKNQSSTIIPKTNSSLLRNTMLNKSSNLTNDSRINNIEQGNINSNNQHGNSNVSNASVIISQFKQMGNKSVLIVKPNQLGMGMSNQNNLSQSRNSKRKPTADNQNKQNRYSLFNKDTSVMSRQNKDSTQMKNSKVSNFFRIDNQQNVSNPKYSFESENRSIKRPDSNLSTSVNRLSQTGWNGNKISSSLTNKGPSSMTKMRSSSTRVSRKQQIRSSNTSISKNQSYTGMGKWKT